MTTHQQLTGQSDEQLLQRMIDSHARRFSDAYWAAFEEHVRPRLPVAPVVVDLGCGPGLLLRDLGRRVPQAALSGYDLTPAMVDFARGLDYGGAQPTLGVLDLLNGRIPMADGTADVVAMNMVLHLFEDPFTLLQGVQRVLKPNGTFLLLDFVRTPFREYLLERPQNGPNEGYEERIKRGLALFAVHNRYTVEDWRWMLGEAGFEVAAEQMVSKFYRLFVAVLCH